MKRQRGMLVLIIVLAVLLVTFFFLYDEAPRYQWYESYRANDAQPYGAQFIEQMLERYRPGETFIVNKKPLKEALRGVEDPANTDYIFIGQHMFLNEEGRRALAAFLEEGGNVFIASIGLPGEFLRDAYLQECDSSLVIKENFTESVKINFFSDSLRKADDFAYAFRFMANDRSYYWNYFEERALCDSTDTVVPLGYQDGGHVNFLKVAVGRGTLYLHSNPLVFTNYFLTDKEKLAYVSGVFSQLDGKAILWDEYSKVSFMGNANAYNSPLYYIMSQPSLKYAWWLLLLTIVLYMFFAAKRKQRVIPVIEGKTNTSLAFVNLISQLHYKNGNHLDMAHKKMKYFLYFVRSKYGIHAERFNDLHIRRLSGKSRVNFSDVEVIFSRYYLIEERFQHNIEANRLVDLFDAIENFYKQCK